MDNIFFRKAVDLLINIDGKHCQSKVCRTCKMDISSGQLLLKELNELGFVTFKQNDDRSKIPILTERGDQLRSMFINIKENLKWYLL